uniref:Uncharacterized protein n=1 Tax=Pseudo-nitzschia australis TaxID=44445 RepID=A0A7S4AMM6_9STRA
MDLASDDEDMTQETFASTTTPTLEVLARKTLPPPPAVANAAIDLASDDSSTSGDSSASSVSTTDGKPAALKDPPTPKGTPDTAAAASASTMAAIMKAANQKVKAGHLWSFAGAGKFLVNSDRATAWRVCPDRIKRDKRALHHYFSTKESEDRDSIHDECHWAIPQAFTASGVSLSSWRSASQEEILAFVKAMFVKDLPE